MEWRRVFGAKGVKGVIEKGETVQLFCGDLDPTLCDPGRRKGLCPCWPRAGTAPAVQMKPNFWVERTMFVPENIGPSLRCSSLLQARGGGCLRDRGPP